MKQVAYPSIEEARKSAEAREGNLRESVKMGLAMKRDLERKKAAQHALKSNGILDVLAERKRQIEAEGWTLEHDDQWNSGEIAQAAACYALLAAGWNYEAVLEIFPWSNRWLKSTTPRRNLVKAGALISAEIERLDRINPHHNGGSNHGE